MLHDVAGSVLLASVLLPAASESAAHLLILLIGFLHATNLSSTLFFGMLVACLVSIAITSLALLEQTLVLPLDEVLALPRPHVFPLCFYFLHLLD